jgi:SAM-dependent methyltransferase
MDDQSIRRQNQRSWDAVVPAHVSHHHDVPGFIGRGGSSLFPEEVALLGDMRGLRIVHLMCNAGLDTLSLANMGARVWGVDISERAITQAQQWATACGLDATFIQADVYDWLATTDLQYERVYCSYGAVCWLNNLHEWAHGVARVLVPGGRFVLMEFHPTSNMFDQEWHLVRDYPQAGRRRALHGIDDYVADSDGGLTPSGYHPGVQDFVNTEPCYVHEWSVADVVTALAQAGLVIERLEEFCYSNGERPFREMVATTGRRQVAPPHIPKFPLLYGISASKKGH